MSEISQRHGGGGSHAVKTPPTSAPLTWWSTLARKRFLSDCRFHLASLRLSQQGTTLSTDSHSLSSTRGAAQHHAGQRWPKRCRRNLRRTSSWQSSCTASKAEQTRPSGSEYSINLGQWLTSTDCTRYSFAAFPNRLQNTMLARGIGFEPVVYPPYDTRGELTVAGQFPLARSCRFHQGEER